MRIFETHSKKAIYMYVKPFYDRSSSNVKYKLMRIEESSRFLYVVQFTLENAIKASSSTNDPLRSIRSTQEDHSLDGGCRGLAFYVTVVFTQRTRLQYTNKLSLKNVNLT